MKEYERHVLWLEYFDSSLSRTKGRRVPTNQAVKLPRLPELLEATKRLGYDPQPVEGFHPRQFPKPSGYVSIKKLKRKSDSIKEIATMLSVVRGELRSEARSGD
jgi:signal recognition particle subunit SRP19